MAEVDILLAAYNGEKYIAEQLDSLLAQTFKDIRILIRDDGSTDRTPEIIEEYAKKYPGIVEVVHDDSLCRHPAKNFFQLMEYAEAEYIMFSDQDDYWLPYKVQITLDYMKKTEQDNPGKPVLAFCGVSDTDEKLNATGKYSFLFADEPVYSTKGFLMGESITGCTEMLNRAAYLNVLMSVENISVPIIRMHDYWSALVVSLCGVICYVPMALVLYRKHASNFTGRIQWNISRHIRHIHCTAEKIY